MSRPETPSSLHSIDSAAAPRPHSSARRSNSRDKSTVGWKLFPTIAEPTPPATPVALQKLAQSRAGRPQRSRSVSFDSTVRSAAGPQNAGTKTVVARKGRKASVPDVKHMSTVQEIPSPTVSIPYSFLPRNSEDAGHARSNSAPGEFVRDSQTLPSARVDLSKPQWTSKHAAHHPVKGLGLSMPASVSTDRLDHRPGPSSSRPKPNLTIEIKKDARLQPKAVVVRQDELDALYASPPPPPPPKSPRHDSRNESLSNIHFEPRKVRRTRSRTGSRSSNRSNSSPESAHPSEQATIASQGSFVKASLVQTPSPSGSPSLPKPAMQHGKQSSYSPLSGDVRIKELMATTDSEAQDDLERPIPPPITPGKPRVASIGRVVSIPSLPKMVSTDKSSAKQDTEQGLEKPSVHQSEAKSTEAPGPVKKKEDGRQEEDKSAQSRSATLGNAVKQGNKSDNSRSASPAVSSTKSKTSGTKSKKPNLDKPMPSLPPPSSRYSEHMRLVRAAEGPKEADAPPVPSVPDSTKSQEATREGTRDGRVDSTDKADGILFEEKREKDEQKQANTLKERLKTQKNSPSEPQGEQQDTAPVNGYDKVVMPKGPALSAFPSIPPPPRYYGRGPQEPPHGRPAMAQHPPTGERRPPPPRDSSPARRFPPGHPMNRPSPPPFTPENHEAPYQPGPPRSRFYGRQPESASNSPIEQERSPLSTTGETETSNSKTASPAQDARTQSPATFSRSPLAPIQSPPTEERSTPVSENAGPKDKDLRVQRPRNESDSKPPEPDTKSAAKGLHYHSRSQDLLRQPQSPPSLSRIPSPAPSARPSSPGDLLNKLSSGKSLPGLPPEQGPRPTTPDAVSILTTDTKATIPDPIQTLRDLTKQSEALHARHASLRADRLKLSTAISASLKDSKPGPEYANSLLDQHLSLNAINSSLDICFAKLKSLDCKKEEAIQALVERTIQKQSSVRRHRATASSATHSTQASVSGHSSKGSTPEIGPLSPLQEQETQSFPRPTVGIGAGPSPVKAQSNSGHSSKDSRAEASTLETTADSEHESITEGLPTPRPNPPVKEGTTAKDKESPVSKTESPNTYTTSPEQKRNTMVKMPTISPAPSLFTRDPVDMSPVSPIEEPEPSPSEPPKRITVKGAKAAKILGLVSEGRPESPAGHNGITLPDAFPNVSNSLPAKDVAVEVKIQRKPVPGSAPKTSSPASRSGPTAPPQPGRKRTNDSASTGQSESSPESEARTPRGSQEALIPRGLRIGAGPAPMNKAQPPQQHRHHHQPVQPVQVVNDDDILDYYSR